MRSRESLFVIPVLALLTMPLAAQEAQPKPGESQKEGQTITITLGIDKELLVSFASQLREATSDDGPIVAELAKLAERYPYTGVGILFGSDARTDADGNPSRYAVRVSSVFRDSGAAKAGIRPGDWLLFVNGEPVGEIPADEATRESVTTLTQKVVELVSASGVSVPLTVERDGEQLAVNAGKAEVGRDISEYLDANMGLWTAYLAGLRPDVEAYEKRIAVAGEDQAVLDGLFEEGQRLFARLGEPLKSAEEFISSRFIN